MKVLSLKVPEALDRKLTAAVKRRGVPKSAVVRQALEQYLDESGEIRRGSFLELAGDLVGSIKDAPADLSTNPRHLANAEGHRACREASHPAKTRPTVVPVRAPDSERQLPLWRFLKASVQGHAQK